MPISVEGNQVYINQNMNLQAMEMANKEQNANLLREALMEKAASQATIQKVKKSAEGEELNQENKEKRDKGKEQHSEQREDIEEYIRMKEKAKSIIKDENIVSDYDDMDTLEVKDKKNDIIGKEIKDIDFMA